MDIIHGERTKKVFRMMLKLGYKTLKTDMKRIGQDLEISQNPVVRNLNTLILVTGGHLKDSGVNWQKDHVIGYGQAMLWTITKDTAYRDLFFWMLNEALKHPDEFREMLKPYVKPPKEWIPNQWAFSMKKTTLMRKKNQIPANGKSMEETIFTPPIQDKRHKKLLSKRR